MQARRALAERRSHTLNTKQAIEQVLKGKRNGMRVPAIIAAGAPLATSLKGKTPGQTIYGVLYSESKKADGLVVQVDRGTFKLNPKRARSNGKAQA
jgi:HB1, ASXL, restriction endonuclease HTH domain